MKTKFVLFIKACFVFILLLWFSCFSAVVMQKVWSWVFMLWSVVLVLVLVLVW